MLLFAQKIRHNIENNHSITPSVEENMKYKSSYVISG